ncbi:peptide ABC transporter ATP-binding protein [Subtercola boreus]|uniref:Peptide ABC transporter ATP-binding protein n=1 Tax=Subtercola boreus TaxID=120213 RepID=A0A3E0VGJ8_9MICO|nr:ABC transporter ATP-binding protein [Subtercola boreus]RFA07997.1 peptide ABC transporter ATP-binding protein [Subtercola boreus]TQL55137.1 putative ABC transport system ATP-binding protein [Subtercola boreus]
MTPETLTPPLPARQHVSAARQAPIAEVLNLSKSFGSDSAAVTALANVTLRLEAGSFTAIMGPSGSGKSTLMHIMAGLDSATSGTVSLGGTDITRLDDRALTLLRRRRIGFVFRSFNLVPTLDARQNILLPFELDGHTPDAEESARMLTLVDALGLTARLGHRPHELSGGQQQRVAIARALVTRPDLVFADEPTGNLDSASSRDVLALLAAASREHDQSIAMVTHDPVAASFADRIVFLADGRVVDDRGPSSAHEISRLMLELEARA